MVAIRSFVNLAPAVLAAVAASACMVVKLRLNQPAQLRSATAWVVGLAYETGFTLTGVPGDTGGPRDVRWAGRSPRESVLRDQIAFLLTQDHGIAAHTRQPAGSPDRLGRIVLHFIDDPTLGRFQTVEVFFTDQSGDQVLGELYIGNRRNKDDHHLAEFAAAKIAETLRSR